MNNGFPPYGRKSTPETEEQMRMLLDVMLSDSAIR